MMDFLFFVKSLCLTVALVLLMQVQIGSSSIETHAMHFVQSSMIVTPLNSVARGAAKLTRDVTHAISSRILKSHNKKEERKSSSSPADED